MDQSQPISVLLIEDDEIDRLLVRTLLSSRAPGSFDLTEATSLLQGLDRLRERGFDLVLLDHTLPQLSSTQELRLVLAEHAHQSVIIHTGYIDPAAEAEAHHLGVREVVGKGELDPLWRAIQRVVEHRGEPVQLGLPSAQGRAVLVVEDEATVRRVIRVSLELAGFTVYEAANGQEALELIHRPGFGIDLVIADLVMPLVAGDRLAQALQRLRPELPVLFVSGAHDDDLLRKMGRLPAEEEMLRKPFTPDELVDRVSKLFSERPAPHEPSGRGSRA